ncbi:MAG: hypothetical protein KAR32_02480 [Candidatus Omnitrophica bacterium]|nr:hypothetical protein [Candidatus Omnitrophota bacterium]
MRKLVIISAVTMILLVGGQQAWAGNKARQTDDDYRTFRKIIHVLDGLINDDYRKGRNYVYVRRYYRPKRVCYFKGPHKVCYLKWRGYHRYGHKHYDRRYSKRRYYNYRDFR